MIKHIIFDVDKTLYSASSPIEKEMIRRMNIFTSSFLGITPAEAVKLRKERNKKYDSTLDWLMKAKGLVNTESFFKEIHPTDLENYFPKNPALVKLISSINVPCSILTNSWHTHGKNVASYLEILPYFKNIFDLTFNNYIGKPNLYPFTNMLNHLNLKPEEVLYIDDMKKAINAYYSLGANVILVDEYAPPLFPQTDPYPIIRYITEIEPLLSKFGLLA